MIIPNIRKNKKCSIPPISIVYKIIFFVDNDHIITQLYDKIVIYDHHKGNYFHHVQIRVGGRFGRQTHQFPSPFCGNRLPIGLEQLWQRMDF